MLTSSIDSPVLKALYPNIEKMVILENREVALLTMHTNIESLRAVFTEVL